MDGRGWAKLFILDDMLARAIGADGYAGDAVAAVALAKGKSG